MEKMDVQNVRVTEKRVFLAKLIKFSKISKYVALAIPTVSVTEKNSKVDSIQGNDHK